MSKNGQSLGSLHLALSALEEVKDVLKTASKKGNSLAEINQSAKDGLKWLSLAENNLKHVQSNLEESELA